MSNRFKTQVRALISDMTQGGDIGALLAGGSQSPDEAALAERVASARASAARCVYLAQEGERFTASASTISFRDGRVEQLPPKPSAA